MTSTSPSLGKKEFEETTNLLVEFVRDTATSKNIVKILELKTDVRIFKIFLKERSTFTVF